MTMKEGLDENHTILGLHLAGNEGVIDAMGFINHYDEDGLVDKEDVGLHCLFSRINPSLEMGTRRSSQSIKLKSNSNCWICEGWSEFQFEFEAPYWVDVAYTPVKLHISCDDFKGELLELDQQASRAYSEAIHGHRNWENGKALAKHSQK